jgi:hypothetical protein
MVGPLRVHRNVFQPFEFLYSPSQSSYLYDWDDTEEPDGTPPLATVREVALALTGGKTNFLEWYFPSRILLDMGAVLSSFRENFPPWLRKYGICLLDPKMLSMPVLAISAEKGVAPRREDYEEFFRRTSVKDFVWKNALGHHHLEMVIVPDPVRNPVLEYVENFLKSFFLSEGS